MTVNGVKRSVGADAETSLLHVLREDLGLKGPRFGCGAGLCGACFVLLDGYPTPSCDTPLWAAEGKDVVTVEGLGDLDSPTRCSRPSSTSRPASADTACRES